MLVNVLWLIERRERLTSLLAEEKSPKRGCGSRATVESRGAGLPLTAAGAEEIRAYLLMLWPTCCMCSCTWLRADGGSIFCALGADSRLGSIADRCDTSPAWRDNSKSNGSAIFIDRSGEGLRVGNAKHGLPA